MKAAVLYGKNNLKVEQINIPEIGKDEVLINVKATGVCGSDIPRVLGDASHYYPNVLGHEFTGQIEKVGSNVQNLEKGMHVSAAPLKPCFRCEDCLSGNHAMCKQYSFIGSREFGAWAEYVKVPAVNVVRLPEKLSFVEGVFLEPLTVALHALQLMDFKPMSTVAITGMGTIGLLTLQCAIIMGAREITVFDIDDEKLKVAKELGATHVVNTSKEEYRKRVNEITNKAGYEMVIETAGVPVTEIMCLDIATTHGCVMFIGTPHVEFIIAPEQFEYINRKELLVRGSWMSYSAPFPGKEWMLGAHYLSTGQVKVEALIGAVESLDNIVGVFEKIKEKQMNSKVIFEVR